MAGTPAGVDVRRSIQSGPGAQDRTSSTFRRMVYARIPGALESASCTAPTWDLQTVRRSGF